MAKLCMGCMNQLPEGMDTCGICGRRRDEQNPEGCLAVAGALQGHYIVGKVVSQESDSVLYLGYDRQLREPCFIQEFYPAALCQRQADGAVAPLGGCERAFAACQEQFRGMMRGLARLREVTAILPVYDIFEENGTIYAVCDYCEGMTLTKKLKLAGGRLPWAEARPLFMSLMSGVAQLHAAGMCHLAICPDNILIDKSGKPRLRGFAIAEARRVGGDVAPQLATGYAAPEQYAADGTPGEAADVYGMAATLFRTVTGNEPPAGNNRAKNSDDLFMSAEVAEELSQAVCVALFNALQVDEARRTTSMTQLQDKVSTERSVTALVDEVEEEEREPREKNHTLRNTLIIVACCLAVVIAGVAIVLTLGGGRGGEGEPSEVVTPPTLSTTTTALNSDANQQATVDNLVEKNYYDLRSAELGGDMTVELAYMMYSDKAEGTVLSQEPAAGSVANKKSVIKVVISVGQKDETLKVPDVSGWKAEHAELYLTALGFRVETVKIQVSTFEKGLVDSTDPAIGSSKLVGDVITLRVSDVEQTDDPESSDTSSDVLDSDNSTTLF